ncbi:MAG TPA: AAA family ATPase [Longimicrobium sp.]|jgi:hypothetical protein
MAASVLKEHPDARAALPLGSFRVAGFRGLRDLRIPELGRVNLFVGMNNAGKSSLLEAIHLYAGGAIPARLHSLLVTREEINDENGAPVEPDTLDAALGRLFHLAGGARTSRMTLGPIGDRQRELVIDRGWAATFTVGDTVATRFSPALADDLGDDLERALEVHMGEAHSRVIPDRRLLGRFTFGAGLVLLHPAIFVRAHGLSNEAVANYWDRVALTDEEDLVTAALRIIAPGVERISVLGDGDGLTQRRVVVRVRGQDSPVPLRTMGDGMNRLLGIVLALATARDGILLVDEIENGIHYSVQAEMWRMILDAAKLLNVQVFATTHSWDCIRAFAAAASGGEAADCMLYRLDTRIKDDIRAVRYTADEVAIAAEQQIEVR